MFQLCFCSRHLPNRHAKWALLITFCEELKLAQKALATYLAAKSQLLLKSAWVLLRMIFKIVIVTLRALKPPQAARVLYVSGGVDYMFAHPIPLNYYN